MVVRVAYLLNTVSRWSLTAAAGAVLLAAIAAQLLTPPPAFTADSGMAGWPRLIVYALAGTLLAVTAAPACLSWRISPTHVTRRAYQLLGLGAAASVLVTLVNLQRLRTDIADRLGPALWLISMGLLLAYCAFPVSRRIGWTSAWPHREKVARYAWFAPACFVALLAIAAAIRLPALGDIPQGINPDEGDRATTSIDLLNGLGPPSWFDSGWFFINMIYFRVLAASLALFGTNVAGGRMLTALTGIAFVGVIGWLGWRNFGPRIGLLAAAFATGLQLSIQHSRLITEAGPTALLWAISIGGFLDGARSGRAWSWVLAGLCGGLSLYFYPSARLWAVGAVLTCGLILAFVRNRRVLIGVALAALASLVATMPFLVHLSQHPDEITGRYAQTAVLDPRNQERLAYLQPPEPLPALLALQLERSIGMFDRYPDGGGFLPTERPVFGAPLAQLTLIGLAFVLVRGLRDLRLAILSVWFWLGLSGVALTVETPDYLRSVGVLPSLCFVLALVLVEFLDRVQPLLTTTRRELWSGLLPAGAAAILLVPQVGGYFGAFRNMPSPWAPETHEGQVVAALGASGPVYSIEMQEHTVNSGWVRLLAPNAERGRVPNPGREVPFLPPIGVEADSATQRPNFFPDTGQGFSILMTPDPNQRPYVPLLQQLYPGAVIGDGGGDQRQSIEVSSSALAAADGVTVSDSQGGVYAVDTFGTVPSAVALPATLTWRAGVRLGATGNYTLTASGPTQLQLRLDEVVVTDHAGTANVYAAGGVHFVELSANVTAATDGISLAVNGAEPGLRQTYRLMDAPWGLLARLTRPTGTAADVYLDSMVSMAFWDPELAAVQPPNQLTWSGSLLAPSTGVYRMAFASEDSMHLELDGQPLDVVTLRPDDWRTLGLGSTVQLEAGAHRVRVVLDVTHSGRELARWNWVPPQPTGAVDANAAWSVVPPWVLRPDAPVAVLP
ncbi:MAG: glycosyltransferase family 39 protein [Chloroflexi bacterium]|nr:glycosyltransferase family 39 protein [Chloroflexota bacterium]